MDRCRLVPPTPRKSMIVWIGPAPDHQGQTTPTAPTHVKTPTSVGGFPTVRGSKTSEFPTESSMAMFAQLSGRPSIRSRLVGQARSAFGKALGEITPLTHGMEPRTKLMPSRLGPPRDEWDRWGVGINSDSPFVACPELSSDKRSFESMVNYS